MELMDTIKGRRSIRKYKPIPVPDDKLKAVLEAMTWAPKAFERWEFIVVKDPDARKRLAKIAGDQKHVEEAPVVLVACSNLKEAGARDRELYSIQESAAAIQNLMLKAFEEGLGTCWIGIFSEAKLSKMLGIPQGVRPVAMITLGYPDETPSPPARKSLDRVVHEEKY